MEERPRPAPACTAPAAGRSPAQAPPASGRHRNGSNNRPSDTSWQLCPQQGGRPPPEPRRHYGLELTASCTSPSRRCGAWGSPPRPRPAGPPRGCCGAARPHPGLEGVLRAGPARRALLTSFPRPPSDHLPAHTRPPGHAYLPTWRHPSSGHHTSPVP